MTGEKSTEIFAASPVAQDYLKLIWTAQTRGKDGLSINELARRTGVVASTASENVRRLVAQGLIDHTPYQKARLTSKGRSVAVGMIRRHRILETYLHEVLNFDWDEVHEEAEILEHAISDRLLGRLEAALKYPSRDPHGDPIPAADGTCEVLPETILLSELTEGQEAILIRVSDRDSEAMRANDALGITLGTRVRMMRVLSEDSGFIVKIGDRESVLTYRQAQILHVSADA
ncbi:metal-dependent transcriptional regulator [Schaalia sp. lx-260]|uniref:metal-dependent transcriptional regulator n=1 Tax=Schaalia sp. lx-260 TaxID=2899082 RepID=UPI001E362FC5|nr:metal-dependent transcriptional regulator [Schaalia sp. lx-260]MCD4549413.1 metal-dependent transcriptional regulator [Schaalia sp. lx-260]